MVRLNKSQAQNQAQNTKVIPGISLQIKKVCVYMTMFIQEYPVTESQIYHTTWHGNEYGIGKGENKKQKMNTGMKHLNFIPVFCIKSTAGRRHCGYSLIVAFLNICASQVDVSLVEAFQSNLQIIVKRQHEVGICIIPKCTVPCNECLYLSRYHGT